MLFLALNTNDNKKIGVDEIADGLQVPKHFLAKILQRMTRHNLASSMKGRNGGFYLSDENRQLSLISIIEAFDGPDPFNTCIMGLRDCSGANPCTLHSQAILHREALLQILNDKTIEELTQDIKNNNYKV